MAANDCYTIHFYADETDSDGRSKPLAVSVRAADVKSAVALAVRQLDEIGSVTGIRNIVWLGADASANVTLEGVWHNLFAKACRELQESRA